jgi:hypothetical protein
MSDVARGPGLSSGLEVIGGSHWSAQNNTPLDLSLFEGEARFKGDLKLRMMLARRTRHVSRELSFQSLR